MSSPTREEIERRVRYLESDPREAAFGHMAELRWLRFCVALLDENERLVESHRFFHDDVIAAMEVLGISIHARPESDHAVFAGEVLPKLKCQAAVVEAAQALAKLSQEGYQTAEEWTTLMDKLIKALAQLKGDKK